jgi:hypothetical protein
MIYERDFIRNAYIVLANAVPQVLSISNPLSIQPAHSLSLPGLGTSISKESWPKALDYSQEKLGALLWYRKMWTAQVGDKKGISGSKSKNGGKGRKRAAEGINVTMLYVVNDEGIPIDGYRAKDIREMARSLWNGFDKAGLAPKSWMVATYSVIEAFKTEMQHNFEELRLCEAGWKVNQIAIDNYPSWRRSHIAGVKVKEEDEDLENKKADGEEDSENKNADEDEDSVSEGSSVEPSDRSGEQSHASDNNVERAQKRKMAPGNPHSSKKHKPESHGAEPKSTKSVVPRPKPKIKVRMLVGFR